jgi:hypothetical protein
MNLCCMPCPIQAKWYPPIMLLLFTLMFEFQLSFFAGTAIGYMHVFGLLRCV